jgi:RNA polymerase sigma-70 factor (ECF subfamily)
VKEDISIDEIVALLPSLKAYALALTDADHKAEDLVQDTLERAWKYRHRFVPGESAKAWLCTIMRNRSVDLYRQDHRIVEDVEGQRAAKLVTNPGQEWSLHYADLLREIDRLSPVSREAVALCWFGGLSHQDAAKVLNWPLGTLKARIKRARDALTQVMDLRVMKNTDRQ